MKILKRLFIGLLLMVALGFVLFNYYDSNQLPQRKAIRRLCTSVQTGVPLDLVEIDRVLKEEGAKLTGPPSFHEPLKSRYSGNLAEQDPHNIDELFILADGHRRESILLSAEQGLIKKIRCNTDQETFEH
jgi:hypothetical protein